MKVLVQRCDTGQYCMRRDGWTNDCDEAQDFETSVRALDFCRKSDVANAQVVLKFENGRYDLVFPTAESVADPA